MVKYNIFIPTLLEMFVYIIPYIMPTVNDFSKIILQEIYKRHEIRNQELFDRVVRFIIENVGTTFSAPFVVKFLKSENRSVSVEAIYNYIKWLAEQSDREIYNLIPIKDHYHKYVVCRDPLALGNVNGIEIVHIADFLLKKEW